MFIKLNKLNNSVDITMNKPTISEISTKASLILNFVPLISEILNLIFFSKEKIFLITEKLICMLSELEHVQLKLKLNSDVVILLKIKFDLQKMN